MRGENYEAAKIEYDQAGTSPRARGKQLGFRPRSCAMRNIPACAGKTAGPGFTPRVFQEHPRVRGENFRCLYRLYTDYGTSPRARGKHLVSMIFP